MVVSLAHTVLMACSARRLRLGFGTSGVGGATWQGSGVGLAHSVLMACSTRHCAYVLTRVGWGSTWQGLGGQLGLHCVSGVLCTQPAIWQGGEHQHMAGQGMAWLACCLGWMGKELVVSRWQRDGRKSEGGKGVSKVGGDEYCYSLTVCAGTAGGGDGRQEMPLRHGCTGECT